MRSTTIVHKSKRAPVERVSERDRARIDKIYEVYDNTVDGDKAVFHGNAQWKLVVERVGAGCICMIIDHSIFTLHHNEELHAFHTARRTAGLGPSLLRTRYSVSNLLKTVLREAESLGIDLNRKPDYIKLN